jgi:hypothetical protein
VGRVFEERYGATVVRRGRKNQLTCQCLQHALVFWIRPLNSIRARRHCPAYRGRTHVCTRPTRAYLSFKDSTCVGGAVHTGRSSVLHRPVENAVAGSRLVEASTAAERLHLKRVFSPPQLVSGIRRTVASRLHPEFWQWGEDCGYQARLQTPRLVRSKQAFVALSARLLSFACRWPRL